MMRDMLGYISGERRAQHTIRGLDVFDLQTADQLVETGIAREALALARDEYPPAARLLQDTFLVLYKAAPRSKPPEEVSPAYRLNQAVIARVMETRAYEELRLLTRLDKAMAFLGALHLWEEILGLLTEEQKKVAREAARQEQQAAQWQRQAEAAQALADATAQAQAEAAQAQAEAAQAQAEAAQAQAEAAQAQAEAAQAQAEAAQAQAGAAQAQAEAAQSQAGAAQARAGAAQAQAGAAQAGNAAAMAEQFSQQAAEFRSQAEVAQKQAAALMEQVVGQVSPPKIRQAIKRATTKLRGIDSALKGWGLEPGVYQRVSPEERLALAQRVFTSSKLRKLAKMVGRFRNLAVAARGERAKQVPHWIGGIELGGDLSRVLPSDLVALHHPVGRLDFYRRLADRQLRQHRLEGHEKKNRGPLVVCYDESDSMAGTKELWAKAVALALLFIAKRQRRPFAAIAFGSPHEIRIRRLPKPERATMEDVLAIAEPFFGGGTDFHRPLTEARKIIEKGGTFKKADIVFITDGIAEVTDDFLKGFLSFKKDTNTRVFVILVDFAGTSERSVRRWADQVYRVTDLARDAENAAKTVFAAI